ncbi:MAG: RpiB/LacA/LacB family sugar-phosphate isomerase [Patescibacteria group bacterium]|jgi:ribose 5-phosphate isomerase B
MKMVYLGADHRGFKLKEIIKDKLREWDYDVVDLGNKSYEKDDDYSDYSLAVAEKTASGRETGVLVCGSGVGVCMAANKVKGVRAGMGLTERQVRVAREDDDINVLCLSSDFVNEEENLEMVKVFLETPFSSEEKHIRRINKIKEYESS